MTLEERRAWIRLVVTVLGYAAYLITVLLFRSGPLADRPYAAAIIWTIAGAILAAMVIEMFTGRPGASRTIDVRDREINMRGEQVGTSFLVIGALAAMLMAIATWDHFWIANVIYLGFVLSAVLGGVTKVVLYRTGLQW